MEERERYYSFILSGHHTRLIYTTYSIKFMIKAHLQELLKCRFSISRDLNFMLSLSVRFNLTETE
jgi:hypothetical protein